MKSPVQEEIAAFTAARLALLRERAYAPQSLAMFRREFDELNAAIPLPDGCSYTPVKAERVVGELLTHRESNTDRALLYHHGGGYTFGSPESHRHLVGRIASAAGILGFNMFYRLAPEHPYPMALEDALANYVWLLDQGFGSSDVVIGGESAGGNLTVALALKIRELGLPQPAGLYLLSPWLDLTNQRRSHEQMASSDVVLNSDLVERCAMAYCGSSAQRVDPLVSPLFADLQGLPPVFVQVGGSEILLSDALDFASSAALAGVDVTLRSCPYQVHCWPMFHPSMPVSATLAIKDAARWIRECLSGDLG